jgi:hypothetical protein
LAEESFVIIFYDQLPAYREAKQREQRTREAAFKGKTYSILGLRIRAMTVRDFVVLQELKSPLVSRIVPSIEELCVFLWIMSKAFDAWTERRGWRRFCPGWFQKIEAYLYGWKCRKILSIREVEKAMLLHQFKTPNAEFELPTDHPLVSATKLCFEYIDAMFLDEPTGGRSTQEPYVSYLGYWSTELFTHNICRSDEEFFQMPIARMFQHLKHLRRREDPMSAEQNKQSSELRRKIVRGINKKQFTAEDVTKGRVKLN